MYVYDSVQYNNHLKSNCNLDDCVTYGVFLSKVQNKDVLWLVLDVDPKKMANASVTVTHIE